MTLFLTKNIYFTKKHFFISPVFSHFVLSRASFNTTFSILCDCVAFNINFYQATRLILYQRETDNKRLFLRYMHVSEKLLSYPKIWHSDSLPI